MLRFSDDDVPLQDAQISKKVDGSNTVKPVSVKKENEGGEIGPNKPNFVYIVCICIITLPLIHLSSKYTILNNIYVTAEHHR